ncbi:MAG: DUF2723 domain-containing protein [Candidatus Eisenbacteria bacterium]|uniref:DUF2723 domain-containing protein n=1 Tax=Eiseniibacteriota bacterium TaxID=2212470 RepID=A0A956RP01_UNCEI|nr:DUF2723 domain-containing protein [Candidatus Eisenbacteria bacterium]
MRLRRGGIDLWGAGLVFIVTQIVYILTVTRSCPFWDSGEFIATSYTLGIPHPPGTPLYVLIGRVMSMIPIASIATRVNYLSALASSVAAAFTFLVTLELYRAFFNPERSSEGNRASGERAPSPWIAWVAGSVAAFFTAFSRTFWDNAIEAEVYALSNLIMTLCLWLVLRWARPGDRRSRAGLFILLFYLLCLAMGIHLGTFLVLPGIVLFALLVERRLFGEGVLGALFVAGLLIMLHPALLTILGWKIWVPLLGIVALASLLSLVRPLHPSLGARGILTWCCIAAVLGISTHAYLMIRAHLNPAINEADPSNWDALWKMLIRDQYKPPNPFLVRKAPFAVQLTRHFWDYARDQYYTGLAPAALGLLLPYVIGLVGAVGHAVRDRRGFVLLFVTYLITSLGLVFYLNFRTEEVRDRDYFFVASFQFFTIWIGLGSAVLLEEMRAGLAQAASRSRALAIGLMSLVLVALPFGTLRAYWHSHDRTHFYVASDFAYNVLSSLEPEAILFTNGDNDTFPLWYLQQVEDYRKDVRVVNLSLLNTDWYMKQLMVDQPSIDLGWPEKDLPEIAMFSGWFAAFQAGQVSRSRLDDFLNAYGLAPYVRSYEVPQLAKDIAVARIVEREYGKRPLYLALTVPDHMGLDPRLVQKGIVMKIEEPKGKEERVDVDASLDLLEHTYRYRGIVRDGSADSKVYKDDNATRLVQNYAASYLGIAQELLSSGHLQRAVDAAERARDVSPQAPAVHYSLGILYRRVGNYPEMEKEFRWMVDTGNADARIFQLLAEALELQEKNGDAVGVYRLGLTRCSEDWELHRALFQHLWQVDQDHAGALEVLDTWLARHPQDTKVRRAREAYADSVMGTPAG